MKIKKIALLAVLLIPVMVGAGAIAETIVQSFNVKDTLTPGWVVALDKTSKDFVIRAPADEPDRIYGVVIDPSSAPLTVQKANQQVFVATSGNYPVIVSTESGPIKAGDYLSLSSTDGVAAKAGSDDLLVLGKALENFGGGTNTILYSGDRTAVGFAKVQVSPGRNPLLRDSGVPSSIRGISESIAGKPVSAMRVYGAIAIFLVAGLIAAVMLWGGIRNSLVAIGRNPLSRHSIMKGLLQVMLAAAAVLIIGLLGVYLLLKI